MRLRVEELTISGTTRTIRFSPGLNVITGAMSGGKTAAVSCLRALFGGDVNVVPELKGRTIAGTVMIGDRRFRIVRLLVTTDTAKVDVAEIGGAEHAWRLPAARLEPGYDLTFRGWYLQMLALPEVRVPRAPSDETSPLVPVTVNDYLMYCILRQDQIDSSVFGTPDNYHKDIKRRYVFEIYYGIFNPKAIELREKLREVLVELKALTADSKTLERVLESSSFSSAAQLQEKHAQSAAALAASREAESSLNRSFDPPATVDARARIAAAEVDLQEVETALRSESAAIARLAALRDQLVAQSRRITRALVAERLLSDFEFHICPRCGSDVPDRGDADTCRLCLQSPPAAAPTPALAAEQDRVIEQVAETDQLIVRSEERLRSLERARIDAAARRAALGVELDRLSHGFLTDQVDRIRRFAAEQARLEEHLARLDDALKLHERLHDQGSRVAELERERDDLTERLDSARHDNTAATERITTLDRAFESTLRSFDAPRFDSMPGSYINRRTYLPVVDGRPFTDLSSQGVEVMVNVAHALAHQLVALSHPENVLPNLLVIDGVSSNVGHEGIDLDRLRKMYATLLAASLQHEDRLQIIIVDNDPPPIPGVRVALTLSDTDRLVPTPPPSG
ncbi:ATP-binding protein [Kitasatospora cineracea]|uniref:AAA domain-containing protein n=1 Tax=Kitasatospora cineracea TaxID=88074 RepID=A0A8G1UM45_9ACTN|nr:ATP-binding protein [Kitasatospora cineracea]ROR46571.1 hypothetical protein EDD39_4853 [Kitasatospora cineracea]